MSKLPEDLIQKFRDKFSFMFRARKAGQSTLEAFIFEVYQRGREDKKKEILSEIKYLINDEAFIPSDSHTDAIFVSDLKDFINSKEGEV